MMLHPTQILSVAVSRLPLAFGIFMGGVLLILIVLSFTRPDALHKYVGAKAPSALNAPSTLSAPSALGTHSTTSPSPPESKANLLSYENYTTFPLHTQEYVLQCTKQHQGYMAHGDYWDISPMGALDVKHDADVSICSSTITYMLDGTVGLSADLAIMSQAAALAREVRGIIDVPSICDKSFVSREIELFWSMTHIGIEESEFRVGHLPPFFAQCVVQMAGSL